MSVRKQKQAKQQQKREEIVARSGFHIRVTTVMNTWTFAHGPLIERGDNNGEPSQSFAHVSLEQELRQWWRIRR